MKKFLMAGVAGLAAVLSLASAAVAQSVERPTITGSVGYANFSADDDGADLDLGAVQGRIGVGLHPNFRVEGEAAFGVNDDDVAGVDVELDHQFAGYAVGVLPLSPNAELFGRIGYGTTEFSAEALGASVDGSEQSVNYGVGGSYYFDGVNGVRADYTRQDFEDDAGEADVFSLSYTRRF